jgi:uncharacterized membrane protein
MLWGKYVSVITASMIKFLGGPLLGLGLGLKWYETAICSVIGMMLTILVFIYGGELINSVIKKIVPTKNSKKKIFSKSKRRIVGIKQKLGLWGIALLTPILLSPVGGAAVSLAFKYPKYEIIPKMFVSGIVWGIVQCLFIYYVKDILF